MPYDHNKFAFLFWQKCILECENEEIVHIFGNIDTKTLYWLLYQNRITSHSRPESDCTDFGFNRYICLRPTTNSRNKNASVSN